MQIQNHIDQNIASHNQHQRPDEKISMHTKIDIRKNKETTVNTTKVTKTADGVTKIASTRVKAGNIMRHASQLNSRENQPSTSNFVASQNVSVSGTNLTESSAAAQNPDAPSTQNPDAPSTSVITASGTALSRTQVQTIQTIQLNSPTSTIPLLAETTGHLTSTPSHARRSVRQLKRKNSRNAGSSSSKQRKTE